MNDNIEMPALQQIAKRSQVPDVAMDKFDLMLVPQPIQIGIGAHPRKVIVQSYLVADFAEPRRRIAANKSAPAGYEYLHW